MNGQTKWQPSHVVPASGLMAWAEPDPTTEAVTLDPGLPLMVTDRQAAWSRVAVSNGWQGWVDGRLLEPATGQPDVTPIPNPEETPALLEAATEACAEALDRFEKGDITIEEFQAIALEAGIVRAAELVWILDWEHGEWYRYDGFSLQPLGSLGSEPKS